MSPAVREAEAEALLAQEPRRVEAHRFQLHRERRWSPHRDRGQGERHGQLHVRGGECGHEAVVASRETFNIRFKKPFLKQSVGYFLPDFSYFGISCAFRRSRSFRGWDETGTREFQAESVSHILKPDFIFSRAFCPMKYE